MPRKQCNAERWTFINPLHRFHLQGTRGHLLEIFWEIFWRWTPALTIQVKSLKVFTSLFCRILEFYHWGKSVHPVFGLFGSCLEEPLAPWKLAEIYDDGCRAFWLNNCFVSGKPTPSSWGWLYCSKFASAWFLPVLDTMNIRQIEVFKIILILSQYLVDIHNII